MRENALKRWSTVLAGAFGCAAGSGVVASYVFGIFIVSIAAEFGWTRGETTLGISAYYVFAGFGALVLGGAISRWGTRNATLAFTLLFALALMLIPVVPHSVLVFTLVYAAMGFFSAAATLMPYAIALSGWFDRGRGTAMALANTGTSLGGLVMPFYATWLLANYGWRGGYAGVGLSVGLLSLVALLLFFRQPPVAPRHPRAAAEVSLRSIVARDKAFWLIGIPLLNISFAVVGALTCLPPMLSDSGASPARIGAVLGALGAASVVSRLGVGLMLDRVHIRYVAAFLFALVALGAALLASGWESAILPAAICIGFGLGAEADLVSYAASRYFGPRALPRTLGAIWIFFAWGAGLGVAAGSLSFDVTGSYAAALGLFFLLALVSVFVVLRLGAYPNVADEEALPADPPGAAAR